MRVMLLVAALAGGILVSPLGAQQAGQSRQGLSATQSAAAATGATPAKTPATYRPSLPRREREYYGIFWGVDSLGVKAAESGDLIRFSWRVLDSNKARLLNDEKVEPYLIDPAAHAKLVVPEMPFMGKMRVKNTPEAGMTYWMAFSNPGKVVKPGDHVIVVVGQFRADGLVVQ